jgi:hypothetical protein
MLVIPKGLLENALHIWHIQILAGKLGESRGETRPIIGVGRPLTGCSRAFAFADQFRAARRRINATLPSRRLPIGISQELLPLIKAAQLIQCINAVKSRTRLRTAVVLCWLAIPAMRGITYKVTLNPDACHEVNLPRLTKPPRIAYVDNVEAGVCRYEIRSARETQLYITAACGGAGKDKFVPAREKYAVDLSRQGATRRIDEETWLTAPQLPRTGLETPQNVILPRDSESSIRYKGSLLARSGPAWHGVGATAVPTFLSESTNRATVNSWDGEEIVYSFLDPTSGFKRNKVKGRYWIDLYDATLGARLLQIQGAFRGVGPRQFQGEAAWYSDRYYVMPLGGTLGLGLQVGLKRLLICDVDAASRKDNSGLRERK